jgi:hypothetical protein
MKKVIATARVRITLDIQLTDRWGNDCPLEQVQNQAKDSVLGMLRNSDRHEFVRAQIVGEPHVTAILTEEER